MKKIYSGVDRNFIAGTLLVLPAAYFFVSAILNDLSVPYFWNLIKPYFDRPENKKFGWNANLLIAFGPVIAILINLRKIVQMQLKKKENKRIELLVSIQVNAIHWIVIIGGLAAITILAGYLIAENGNFFVLKTGSFFIYSLCNSKYF